MRIGVDLGGTKIEAVVLDAAGVERVRRRVPTPTHDYAAIVAAVAALVHALEAELGERCSVGVGTPGALSRASGLLKNANTTVLNGRALDADLAAALARPVRIANDANCFALSEAADGAAAGAEVVFGVILGTGVGGGVVVRGAPLTGANAIAGEWGHNALPGVTGGPPCYCGREGCIETWLSGPGLRADHLRVTGADLDARAIAERAAAGDPASDATLARWEERLARGLAAVVNLLDPDVIVLGGGLSLMARTYVNVPKLWGQWIFSDHVDTRLVPARHGDSSGVRGAAWLWPA